MTAGISEEWMICRDCLLYIATGDFSSLDAHYPPAYSARRAEAIEMGVEGAMGYACPGDSKRDLPFSTVPCECCGWTRAGPRHHCLVLGYERRAESAS